LQILGSGTSTGVPIPGCGCAVCSSPEPKNKRTRTSAALWLDDGRTILIDASPDLRAQCLSHGVKRVDAVLFTHAHADHILGIDDLRAFNFIQRSAISCYGSIQTLAEISRFFSYILTPDSNYEGGALARLNLNNLQPYATLDLGVQIQTFTLLHGKTEVTGYRFGSVAYATDCNGIPDRSLEVLRGIETLVIDGLRYEPHRTHFTIPEAIDAAASVGAKRTILTHLTHAIDHESVTATLPVGVELAFDGLSIEVNPA
ncbi:MAG: MBL fold metallo-hydrolase, partial [Proteobacteria bacterium]|nr:MBL fold metallo-hydrolase [Pseudomonadota bacterium]